MNNDMYFVELFGNIDERFINEAALPWRGDRRAGLWKKISAAIIMLLLLGAVAVSSETVMAKLQFFTSAIAELLGLEESALSYTEMVGHTVSQNGMSVTLGEVLLDNDQMIVSYEVKSADAGQNDPLMLGEAWINDHKLNAYDSYSDGLDYAPDYVRKVQVYYFSEEYISDGKEKIKILLQPKNVKTGEDYGKFAFEFQASADELKGSTLHVPLTVGITLDTDSILRLKELTLNAAGGRITGTCQNLSSSYQSHAVVYYLKGTDDLGNGCSYRLSRYSNPDVTFTLETKESYISPLAKTLSLQLYGCLLENHDGNMEDDYFEADSEDVHVSGENEISADYELDSTGILRDEAFSLFAVGEKFEIEIKDKQSSPR